ncbi:MAG: NUDIX hydrolase [Candidatus Nanopelagicales bacterium]
MSHPRRGGGVAGVTVCGLPSEVYEELGLHLALGRLLALEYQNGEAQGDENLHFILDAGVLDRRQIAEIRLPPAELSSHLFLAEPAALELLVPRVARRVALALHALRTGATVCLENGRVISQR